MGKAQRLEKIEADEENGGAVGFACFGNRIKGAAGQRVLVAGRRRRVVGVCGARNWTSARMVETVHSWAHAVHRHRSVTARTLKVTSARRVHTPWTPHSGQASFMGRVDPTATPSWCRMQERSRESQEAIESRVSRDD